MNMTLVELRSAAEEYFRRHLAREEWKLLPEEVKQSALAGAEADVALYLDRTGIDPENRCECGAVFEQAIHLARKPPCSGSETAPCFGGDFGRRPPRMGIRRRGRSRITRRVR